MASRVHIRVSGIVQGVGMRPFVYSLAARCGVSGWVLNDSRGVGLVLKTGVGGERIVEMPYCEALPRIC